MAQELFFDKAVTTVSSGGTTAPAAGTTESWTVASSATFVDANALTASSSAAQPRQFRVVDPADTSTVPEIILVTNVSGTTWSVTRGAEGTTPFAHASGFTVKAVPTSASLGGGSPAVLLDFTVNDYMLLSQQVGTGSATNNIGSTATNSNNRLQYVPFRLGRRRKFASLALAVSTANAGASAVVRLGIHADNGSGRPGAVVVDAGTASVNTTGVKELTFTDVWLEPGLYWAVAGFQSIDTAGTNPAVFTTTNGTQGAPETAPAATAAQHPFFQATGISGALAASPTTTIVRTATPNHPHIWAKVTG